MLYLERSTALSKEKSPMETRPGYVFGNQDIEKTAVFCNVWMISNGGFTTHVSINYKVKRETKLLRFCKRFLTTSN